jgi:hypothetical protein
LAARGIGVLVITPLFDDEVSHERWATDLPFAKRNRRDEILPLDVFDKRVLRVVSARWPREAVPLQFQLPTNLGPLFWVITVVRMPDARRCKAVLGFEMQVEDGRMRILAAAVREMYSDSCSGRVIPHIPP